MYNIYIYYTLTWCYVVIYDSNILDNPSCSTKISLTTWVVPSYRTEEGALQLIPGLKHLT